MKIFFRYLFMRLLIPFLLSLGACAIIWIMVDLYGNIDDFIGRKINVLLILRFYSLQIPSMLVQVLPATLLFSTLATLINLNRRSELVALQAGGLAPIWIFSPFLLFASILVLILAIDMSGPAAQAQVTRERLLKEVKGQKEGRNIFTNLPYVDSVNRRVWFFQKLDANQGSAKGVELLEHDALGHDMKKYFAREARWEGGNWKLYGVLEIIFGVNGFTADQKIYQELDLPDVTTPPKQLSLIISQPDQLTVPQLNQYILTSTSTPEHLAAYRTEWWYRVLYPLTLLILLIYALLHGMRTDRHGAAAGVFWAIFILLAYTMVMNVFMAAGRFNRISPLAAVLTTQVLFGAVGLHLLAVNNGWWWQIWDLLKKWRADLEGDTKEEA